MNKNQIGHFWFMVFKIPMMSLEYGKQFIMITLKINAKLKPIEQTRLVKQEYSVFADSFKRNELNKFEVIIEKVNHHPLTHRTK